MIKSRRELNAYIKADRERQSIKYPLLSAITYSESYLVRHYLIVLRHYEYWLNKWEEYSEKSFFARLVGGGHFCTSCFVFPSLEKVMY